MEAKPKSKMCSKCKRHLQLRDFYKYRRGTSAGRQGWCKKCTINHNKEIYLNLKDAQNGQKERGMKIKELIIELEKAKSVHGNVECVIEVELDYTTSMVPVGDLSFESRDQIGKSIALLM